MDTKVRGEMFVQFAQLHFPPPANRDLSLPSYFSFVFLQRRFAFAVLAFESFGPSLVNHAKIEQQSGGQTFSGL